MKTFLGNRNFGFLTILLLFSTLCPSLGDVASSCAAKLGQSAETTDEILYICKQLYEFREKNEEVGPCTALFSLKNKFEDKILVEDENCYAKVR